MNSPGKEIVSIAFCIRSSDKNDECNCVIKKVKSEAGDYPSIIECTVINNTKKIVAGEELVFYRERRVSTPVQKTVKLCLDNSAQQHAKKAKFA